MLITKIILIIFSLIMGLTIAIKGLNLYEEVKKNKNRLHEAEIIFLLTSMLCITFIVLAGSLWIEISKEIL